MRPNVTEDNALSRLMNRLGIPVTRENYLDLAFMGEPPKELSHEQETDVPHHIRKSAKGRESHLEGSSSIVDRALDVVSKNRK